MGGDQIPRSHIEKWKKFDKICFNWNLYLDYVECQLCSFTCKSFGIAKNHFKQHDRMLSK